MWLDQEPYAGVRMIEPAPIEVICPVCGRSMILFRATLEPWYRILSQALKKFLRGRKLVPPRSLPAGAASYS
jgi:hypothetical protein